MPSPFHGMDPYLEAPAIWAGFHSRLYQAISLTLNRTLPPGYYAEIEEYVWLQTEAGDDRLVLGRPDTSVAEVEWDGTAAATGGAVATAPTARTTLPRGARKKMRHVAIVAPDHQTVVTVIEVLSPTNKRGEFRTKYLDKRGAYFATDTNLVEIDLLRDGEPMPKGSPSPAVADYSILVSRAVTYPQVDIWAFTVREPIPVTPVPLKPGDPEPTLDLQSLAADIYDANRYAQRIDYSAPPVPPLRAHDAEWAATRLAKPKKPRKGGK